MFYEIVCISELYTSVIKSYDFFMLLNTYLLDMNLYWNWVKTFVHLFHRFWTHYASFFTVWLLCNRICITYTYCLNQAIQATQATWVLFARKNNKYNWFYLLFSLDLTFDVYNLFWMKLCLAAGSMILRLHICSFCFGALIEFQAKHFKNSNFVLLTI